MAQTPVRPVCFPTMKHLHRTSLLAAALFASATLLSAADAAQTDVAVNFHEAEKFTDARSRFGGSTEQHYLDSLAAHLMKQASLQLAPGQRLEVTFTDVDLAGEFNTANSRQQDIRIIKEIYLPRQQLSFRLIGEDGQVLKEGERRLSDLNFMNNPNIIGRNEPLFYDKALLSEWVRKEFKS